MLFTDECLNKNNHHLKSSNTLKYIYFILCVAMSLLFLNFENTWAQQCTSEPVLAGYRDFNYDGGGVTSEPTEEKPESKLWYNDGFWWGVLYEPGTEVYSIYRFDLDNQCWIHVGPAVDDRGRSSQDALWDETNQKLYVATHAKKSIQSSESKDARIYRYSYNSSTNTYTLDNGFPVTIGSEKTRALVLAKDSSGQLWATWTDNAKVMVNRSTTNDLTWGTPFVLPTQGNDLKLDTSGRTMDISSVYPFGGNKIGIFWGNQLDEKYYFSVHIDSNSDTVWEAREIALEGLFGNAADDHLNVHSHNGTVLAVVKSDINGATNPLIRVLKRNSTTGNWSEHTMGLRSENHTRPILLLDSDTDSVYVFAKSDDVQPESIYYKVAHLDNLTFPSGLGRLFMSSEIEDTINNPTSTKQNVNATTGILVLASAKPQKRYMHNYLALGGNVTPIAVDDSAIAHENTAVNIDVTDNDTDANGSIDETTVQIVDNPQNGVVSVNATTGIVTYTPNTGFTGTDNFMYSVKDDDGESTLAATVTVTVNALPVAVNDVASTNEETAVVISVTANDSDADGTLDLSTVAIASAPPNGTTSVNSTTGDITYTPNQNFTGTDSFTYTIDDNNGGTSNAATVTISVSNSNDPPSASDDVTTTNEDNSKVIDVLANDSDIDGTVDATTVTVTGGPSNGSTQVDGTTGDVTYTPSTNFFGTDSFTYTVNDNNGATSNEASVTITVTDVNDVPVAGNDVETTAENTAITINVLVNDSDVDGTLIPSSVTVVSGAINGSTNVNGTTGEISYTPNQNFTGTDVFTYTVDDDDGTSSNAATVTVTINDLPVAADDAALTNEDSPIAIDVLVNDSDSDGTIDPTTVTIVSAPNNGTTTVDGVTGTVTYTPQSNFFGTDTFTYTVDDNQGDTSNEATVTVEVNRIPIALNDAQTTDEDVPVDINVLANDVDLDGSFNPASVTVVSTPSNGTTTVNGTTGAITYTPNQDYFGNDTFNYIVDDNDGATSNAATVTITINAINDPPTVVDDAVSTDEDTQVNITVLANDVDVDDSIDPTTVAVATSPSNGTTSVDGTTGEITYSPAQDFFGTDSFTYTVNDNVGAISNAATVTVTVNDVNDAPVATDDATLTDEDVSVQIDVLANDSDVDGTLDPATVTVVTSPLNGTTSVDGTTGEITYTPAQDFFGTDSFTYTVNDDDGASSNAATVTVTVNDVNDAPVAADDVALTSEEVGVQIDVLVNDSDVDGTLDQTTVSVVTSPSNGTTSVDGTTGAITYTPSLDFTGTDSFTYQVNDDDGASSNAGTVTITVTGQNDAPVAVDDAGTTDEDVSVQIDVLANDSDVDGTLDPTTVAVVTSPSNGTTSVDGTTGEITYTPAQDFFGTDSFTYTVNDNVGAISNAATVTVTVNDVNDAPVALNDAASTDEDVSVQIDVLVNDSDVDGTLDPTTVAVVTSPLNGTTSVDGTTGEITYTPAQDFFGTDSFTYTVNDDDGASSNAATVTVTVNDVNDAPVAADDVASTSEEVGVQIDVLVNDSDVDGTLDQTTVSVVTSPSNGTTSVDGTTGAITYTPSLDFTGTDSFTYQVNDDDGANSNAGTVTIMVTGQNDAPVAVDDAGTTDEDVSVQIDVLANDSDVDGTLDPATVTVVTSPSNGTTSVDGTTGEITYIPAQDFFGTDSFTYTVNDDVGAISNTATVTVTVNDVNDAPVALNDAASTDEDVSVQIDVLVNDSDVDGTLDATTVSVVTSPSNGTTLVDGTTGAITYTPNLNFTGTDSFTYQVNDDDGANSNAGTVTVTVTGQNDAPVAVDDAGTTDEDVSVQIDVLANDSDVDGTLDPTTVTVATPPSNGTTSVDGTTGVITYTPTQDYFGTDSFTYQASDDGGAASNVATVTVTVNDVNDAPVAADDAASTDEDVPVQVDVLANDSEVDGSFDPATVSVETLPSNGTTTIDGTTGEITYTPNQNYFGTDSFTYTVNDDDGAISNVATVIVTVTVQNDTPVAVNDAAATDEDVSVQIDVLNNDSDVDGTLDPTTVSVVTSPSNGTTTVDGTTGLITYTPNQDYFGTDSFTYTVNDDGGAASNAATVTVTVNDVNDAPVAVDDGAATNENTGVVIGVLLNDSDIDGTLATTTVSVVTSPLNGTTSINGTTGEITFTPNQDFSGQDSFTYTVNDDDGAVSNVATVIVTVNDAPIAIDDVALTTEETPIAINVLSNDSDSDGNLDPSTVVVVVGPNNGSTTIDGVTGIITYAPQADFFGEDTFTYKVDDNDGATSDAATVTVTVTREQGAPVAVNDVITTDEDIAIDFDVTVNDFDVDGTIDVTSVSVSGATNGLVSVLPTYEIRYVPNANFSGTDSFIYTVRDNDGLISNTATVSITVNIVNDTPLAVDDVVTVNENSTFNIDVLSNDSDIDGTLDLTSVTVVTPSNNGSTSVIPATGEINYTPNPGYSGPDSFTYTVTDDGGAVSNTATVAVTVNDLPIASDDAAATNEDTPIAIDVLANDNDSDGTLDPAAVTVASAPNNGTTTVDGTTGAITYLPQPNFFGDDSFTYKVSDNDGGTSNEATVTVHINRVPVAVNDTKTTDEDVPVEINVMTNDIDLDGSVDPSTVTIVTNVINGSTSINATTGIITYLPNSEFSGADSFTYTVNDNEGATSNVATVAITINETNDPPVAVNDAASTGEELPVDINVTANDSDIDGSIDLTTLTVVSGPSNGSTSVNQTTGVITYSPNANFFGTDSFTYTIDDDRNATSNEATVTITISGENDPPVAVNDSANTNENESIAINVIVNDADIDGTIDPTKVTVLNGPGNGTTSVNTTTGVITYTPTNGFSGTDSFTYMVYDDNGANSNAATVTVTVNDLPVAVDDTAQTNENEAVAVNVTANDSDSDGNIEPTTLSVVTSPNNGTTSIDGATGVITYTPNNDFSGTDTFTYTIQDNNGATSNEAIVTVKVNDKPIAADDAAQTDEDQAVDISVTLNDSDSDGTIDPRTVSIVSGPANGSTSVNNVTGVVTYTPNSEYFGTDTFTYTVDDNHGFTSNAATVTVTIADVNDSPIAVDDAAATVEDTPVQINVLSNDSDVDGSVEPTTVVVVTQPTNGTTTVDGTTGQITYTPNQNYEGADTFTYTVDDDDGATSNIATVTLSVSSDNDPPVAVDDAVTTDEDVAVQINVLTNDSDVDGNIDPTTVAVVTQPTNGTTSVDGTTGEITYAPNQNFEGTDSFTYTVQDNIGATSNAATVIVTVTGDNDPPVAVDDAAATAEDVSVQIDVLANDSDVDGSVDPATVVVGTPPTNGTTTVDATTGAITYNPTSNFFGSDTFTYTVKDDAGLVSNTATVTINVTDVNDSPIAVDDTDATAEDTPVQINVLDNDSDVDGNVDPTTVAVISTPANGSTTVNGTTGIITYTPDQNFEGTDSFTYTVNDDDGASSNVAIVTVTVSGDNDPPVALNDAVTTDEDLPIQIDVLANDSDVDGSVDPTTVAISTPPSNGLATVNATTGVITYTPGNEFFGSDLFAYTVKDNIGLISNVATVNVTILEVKDPPIAQNDVASTNKGTPVIIDVLANDSGTDGVIDPTTVSVFSSPFNGSTSVNGITGEITYTPNPGFAGADAFTYTVKDNNGVNSNIASVTVNVSQSLQPIEDSFVRSTRPTNNYGGTFELRLRKPDDGQISTYLKFVVSGLEGSVASAKIRLYVIDDSDDGGTIHLISNNYQSSSTPWDEDGLIWNNAPEIASAALSSVGAVQIDEIVEFDVTSAIVGNGTYSFAVKNNSTNALRYNSKESPNPPEMIIVSSSSSPLSPSIISFTPTSGAIGTEVTIIGTNFTGISDVTFNGSSATSFTVDSNSQLRVFVPIGATTGKIGVTNSDGTGISVNDFTVILPPTITSFTPSSGPIGMEVTIFGLNLASCFGVSFNGTAASSFTVDSNTQIRASVPAGATTGTIMVTNTGGAGISSSNFTLIEPPVITSFTPTSGTFGTEITLSGSKFTGVTGVAFNGVSATNYTVDSATQIRAEVPTGASTGPISVSNTAATATSSTDFNVVAPPIITAFTPAGGLAGVEVTITGGNLGGALTVAFNGTSSLFSIVSDSQILAQVPVGATTGPISITNNIGTGISSNNFNVTAPPSITSFTPVEGAAGTEVTISGSNFNTAIKVVFNGTNAPVFTVDSNTQIRVLVPASASTGKISVTNPAGADESLANFIVLTGPSEITLQPTDDAYVRSSHPTTNRGTGTDLRARTTSSVNIYSFLKFNVTGMTGQVLSAKIALTVRDGSNDGGSMFLVSNNYQGSSTPWDENGIIYNNAPDISGAPLSSIGPVNDNDVVEFDVTAAISGNGIFSFGLRNASTDAVNYRSNNTNDSPQLIINTSSGGSVNAPSITSFSPSSGVIGTEVTIVGDNFNGTTDVSFNALPASSYVVDSNTQIRAIVDFGTSTGKIAVTNSDGTGISTDDFVIAVSPVISSFTPTNGPVGTEVTLNGNNFLGISQVSFNGALASLYTIDSNTELRAVVPSGASTGQISVTNPAGTTTSIDIYSVTAPSSSLTLEPIDDAYVHSNYPTRNHATSVELRVRKSGANIYSYFKFSIAGLSGTPQSAKLRLYVINDGSDGGSIYLVSNNFKDSTTPWNEEGIFYNNAPDITGDALFSIGQVNLNTIVEFDLTAAITGDGIYSFAIKNESNDLVNYNSKESSNKPQLIIEGSGGTTTLPSITSFSPTTGLVGDAVTITGFNFTGTTNVSFNGVPNIGFNLDSDTQIRANVPNGATTGKISVTTGSGTAQSAADFTVTASQPNYALSFDGTDDMAIIPDNPLLSGGPGKSITVEAWVNMQDVSAEHNPIVAKYYDGAFKDWGLDIESGMLNVNIESTDEWSCQAGLVPVGKWTHLAFTFDNTADVVRLYINGVEAGTGFQLTRDMPDTPADIWLGAHSYNSNYRTNGIIDEVRIWNYPRSLAELQSAMNLKLTGSEPGLIGYWPFDEGSGQLAADLTGNGNHASLGVSAGADINDPAWVTSVARNTLPLPTIAAFTPTSGDEDMSVTITGANFSGTTEVAFNGTPVTNFTVDSDTQLRATVPIGASTGRIRVTNAHGFGFSTSDFTIVLSPGTFTFTPQQDTYARGSSPTMTDGDAGTLRLEKDAFSSYLKFNVTGLDAPVWLAKLRLYVINASIDGGSAHFVSNNLADNTTPWIEDNLNWENAPPMNSPALSTLGPISVGTLVEFDVTAAITGDGIYSFGLTNNSSDRADYSSTNGTIAPVLVIKTTSNPPTVLQLISPNGGEDWPIASSQNITWGSPGNLTNVKLEFSTNNGTSWTTIVASIPDDGSYSWTVPDAVSNQCLVRVSDAADGDPSDVSNAAFSIITPPPAVTLTFNPIADTYIRSTRPTENFGTSDELKVRKSSSLRRAYLKFNVAGLGGNIQSAILRLRVLDASNDGGSVFSVSNNYKGTGTAWVEQGINWDNAPEITGAALSTVAAVNVNSVVEFDVTATIAGNGSYSLAIKNNSSDLAKYSSKEGIFVPELVILTEGGSQTSPPSISSFTPTDGPVGTECIINGNNFTGVTNVSFNGTAASNVIIVSNIQIRATVPAGATTGTISVTNADGTATSANVFSVLAPPAISTFTPTNGPVTTEVTITGVNFSGLTDVSFNGTSAASINLDSDTQIRANVPTGAATGPISVSNAIGTATSANNFNVTNEPGITSFSPASGPTGTQVTVTGINFVGATVVSFNGAAAQIFTVVSNTQIRVNVPSGASTGKISITNSDGTGTSTDNFNVVGPPTITSFTPSSGVTGTEVTIIGTNFTGVTNITFDGATASSYTIDSPTQLRSNVPASAITGPISVTNVAGTATSVDDFTVSSGSGTFTFLTADDAFVRSDRPSENFGAEIELKVRKTSVNRITFLKFNVTGLGGTIQSAIIRLKVTNGSDDGGSMYSVSNNLKGSATSWNENNLIWNNSPEITGTALSSKGTVNLNEIVEFDVTLAIVGNGMYSFAIKNASYDIAVYSSKEGSTVPELVVTTGSGLPKIGSDLADDSEKVETEISEEVLPEQIALLPNYPNPFNAETNIQYTLPQDAKVKLAIFNLRGQLVSELINGEQKAGIRRVSWNGRNADDKEVSSGVYFMRLQVGDLKFSKKITLQK